MKRIKLFEEFLSEAKDEKLIQKSTGYKAEYEGESTDEGRYKSVATYSVDVPGMTNGQGEDFVYVNVYDGKDFQIWYDAAPLSVRGLHSKDEMRRMGSTMIEEPKPLSKLKPAVFKSVIDELKQEFED